MCYTSVINYVRQESIELVEWAKCGDSGLSVVPTVLWAVGAAALAQRIVTSLFRRFLFRRVPLWEVILQNLLFIWMIIYSLHFWIVVVNIMKFIIEYCYELDDVSVTPDDVRGCKVMQQWVLWMCGAAPLAFYYHTRPRPLAPPLMIWITTSPWQRREMGAYGYYLNRPLPLEPLNNLTMHQQALTLRRAFSDSRTVIKEPPRKRRISKSI